MKNKMGKTVGKKIVKRGALKGVNLQDIIKKDAYHKETEKLTDRLIPKIKSYGELAILFADLDGEIFCEKNIIKLIKLIENEQISSLDGEKHEQENEEQRVIIQIKIEQFNEECDCLKFIVEEGNAYYLREVLSEFDKLNMGEDGCT